MTPEECETRVVTAGVYVRLEVLGGLMPFMVGQTNAGNRLGVVRVGGHREPGESSCDCARREALEEAGLRIEFLRPPMTYRATMNNVSRKLLPEAWPNPTPETARRCSCQLVRRIPLDPYR